MKKDRPRNLIECCAMLTSVSVLVTCLCSQKSRCLFRASLPKEITLRDLRIRRGVEPMNVCRFVLSCVLTAAKRTIRSTSPIVVRPSIAGFENGVFMKWPPPPTPSVKILPYNTKVTVYSSILIKVYQSNMFN